MSYPLAKTLRIRRMRRQHDVDATMTGAASQFPSMPAGLARDLRARMQALPPRTVRYVSDQGQQWLIDVRDAARVYGVPQVAEVLGLARQTVYELTRRPLRERTWHYPTEAELDGARGAWLAVEQMNRRGRQVRRTSPEYERMHQELKRLRRNTSWAMIAGALGVPMHRLRDFEAEPAVSHEEQYVLSQLYVVYIRADKQFSRHLRRAARSISVAKIARALNRPVHEVEEWLGHNTRTHSDAG